MTKAAHKITVDAPTTEVFKAITTVEGLKAWYTGEVKGNPDKLNGEFTLSFAKHEGPFRWKITAMTPHSEVRWNCETGPGRATGTKAIFRFSPKGDDKTIVDFEHDGFEDTDEKINTCNTLWGHLLSHLKEYAETQKPAPAFK